ncbi:unnamed protein product [Toxocara canis]|uniref:Uncharacterized protein n=1 Tax=Toxocara canis TaxID=6265 RepID=A0A183V2U1_TOXCA|nr:unnamed protein product [Toxocara canis]
MQNQPTSLAEELGRRALRYHKTSSRPGSNRRPPACEAGVITATPRDLRRFPHDGEAAFRNPYNSLRLFQSHNVLLGRLI